jgi:hypothetical protein
MADEIWEGFKNLTHSTRNNALLPRRQLTADANQSYGKASLLAPRADASLNALVSLLSQRGTDQDRASLINRRSGNLTSNYLNARSRIQAGMGGRLPNSMEAGQMAALEGSHANALSGLYNDADDTLRDSEMGNAQALLQVLSGARQNARGEWLADTGLIQGMDQTALSNLGNLAQFDEARIGRKAQQNQGWIDAIGSIAQLFGGAALTGGGGTGGGEYAGNIPWPK